MWGEGDRRVCPTCGQGVAHIPDKLSHRELRGPRNITSSNIDRHFDDGGKRHLFIEEKQAGEPKASNGQKRALAALSYYHDVWVVKGTPELLQAYELHPDGYVEIFAGDWDTYQTAVLDWFENKSLVRVPAEKYPVADACPECWSADTRVLSVLPNNSLLCSCYRCDAEWSQE